MQWYDSEFKLGLHLRQPLVCTSATSKGWFPYDRRRSRTIAMRPVSIQSQTIANDRRADCSYTFRSAEMSYVLVRCARGKIKANNMADNEEEILLQANLFLFLVLKPRQVSFKT